MPKSTRIVLSHDAAFYRKRPVKYVGKLVCTSAASIDGKGSHVALSRHLLSSILVDVDEFILSMTAL